MRPRDIARAETIRDGLIRFSRQQRNLPGVTTDARMDALLEQILESIHRVQFPTVIASRSISLHAADPKNDSFDPLKAAILARRAGSIDDACWLVFLFVHFGKHRYGGWRYAREVFSGLEQREVWNWIEVSRDPKLFRTWLISNEAELRRPGSGFGNHRKYQSLNAESPNGTGSAVTSYVNWVNPPRTHEELFDDAIRQANGDPKFAFDILYHSMSSVRGFGRTARFDYLTMIGKLNLAGIEPGSPYLSGATGPLAGARLLFGNDTSATITISDLHDALRDLDAVIHVGMQVLEDALCNWQKSPDQFVPFRG